ncbi:sensor histidine kinase [Bradyrhizobium sp. STM 3562]|uniref:sensor histidine kinase n=1 Tax=Bradyrhizobium sp. STM 3562 TaxID=578924 RepID=UPI003890124D
MMVNGETVSRAAFEREVADRFGLLPNLFRSAPAAPGLIEEIWIFGKSAYLDNPLPSLLKERLFVHLSRFCGVPYCLARHIGFLLGKGRPAGDARAAPETLQEAGELLARPLPNAGTLDQALVRLEALRQPAESPAPRSQMEADLFDAASVLFVAPRQSERARLAIRNAWGDTKLELLTVLLAFIRMIHYWSETHPDLGYEPDITALLREHPELAALMPDANEAQRAQETIRRISSDGPNVAPSRVDEDQNARLLSELQHRTRNTLAVIRSIVRRTAETSETTEDFANHLDGRIGAISRVQLAVARDPLAGFDLAALLSDELCACAAREGEQFELSGPQVHLNPKAAENIGLAIHELATNAVKHGAFTAQRGRIEVNWWTQQRADSEWLCLHWKESGMAGRPVKQTREGFGSILLQQMLQYDLGAEVTQAFEPSGYRCEIAFPLRRNRST